MSAQWAVTEREPEACGGLDGALELIEAGRVQDGMESLVATLRTERERLAPGAWRGFVRDTLRPHPIRKVVHEDPLTSRSFAKPRGIPGDAVMMDLIYGTSSLAAPTGRSAEIHRYTTNRPASRAMRHRRQLLARLIDETAVGRRGARVLAIGCGHLREAELSAAVRDGGLGELVAVDQDAASLEVVARAYGPLGVRTEHESVRGLISGSGALRGFDLVYTAGLFDALDERTAGRLCEAMFGAARPGGRVLLTSFLPGIPDAGYMEGLMDWNVVHRSEPELLGLAGGIPRRRIADLTLSFDDDENVAYLSIGKKGPSSLASLAAVGVDGADASSRPERRARAQA
jgi:extracellular factor (EF) 3-hydroxypalmitic acid methyl ester biosynthesis protein